MSMFDTRCRDLAEAFLMDEEDVAFEANIDELALEIQHAMDLGALVIVIPTVRSVEEGKAARDWTMFPPLGKRSQGGGQAFDAAMWGSVPGGYRNTINDNVVLIEMIETIEGVKNAREIAAVPGVTAIFAASVPKS